MTGSTGKLTAALLGVSHPHTSGRTRVLMEKSIPILGAWDDDPVIEPFTKQFEIPNRSLDELLADPDISVILIHSKSHSMVPLAVAALRAGKAVLVEKPGGKNPADLETLVRVVQETDGICQVGYSYRFSLAVRMTEEILGRGVLGQIHQVRIHGGCSLGEAATSHLNQPDDIGGAFFVIGCHLVDLLVHHLGMPATVNAKIPKFPGVFGASCYRVFWARPSGSESNLDKSLWSLVLVRPASCMRCCLELRVRKSSLPMSLPSV
jgi:predicted dehydrogenase